MSQDLLFEIGAEEIPASYIQPALDQMKALAEAFFVDSHLTHQGVRCEGSPRRLALMVKQLQAAQADRSEEAMGPSAKAAIGPDGKPTQVGLGFAKGKGVDPAALTVKPTPKGDYVFAQVSIKGRPTPELLQEWLPQLVKKLNFPKSMRWGDGGPLRFARPINWLCGLYGSQTLAFELEHLKNGATTRGHRFLAPAEITLKDAGSYEASLAAAHVVLSFDARKATLKAQLEKAAAPHGKLLEDEELLIVVANLLEKPVAFAGTFDPAYLVLPKAVIVKVLREHQFAFAVEKADGKLAPIFIATTNGIEKNLPGIVSGNARVIRARLEDAKFFYTEDQKTGLEQRREELKAVVWQEKLGTMYDRVERLEKLAAWVAERLDPSAKADAARAARLCKSDLVTLMVGEKEFTSLQGEMGGEYARIAGEPAAVCAAMAEHYRPRFAADAPPATVTGRAVALADKMDELVGSFGIGLIPSGSQDPYALRRKASGIVTILRSSGAPIGFEELAQAAAALYPQGKLSTAHPELMAQIRDFFRARLENALQELGFESDLVAAVAAAKGDRVGDAFARAAALKQVRGRADFAAVTQAFSRVTNILEKAGEAGAVQEALLEEGAEKALWKAYLAAKPGAEAQAGQGQFVQAFEALAGLRESIDAFFNDVMVMAEDPKVRANRLSMLAQIAGSIGQIADFRKLVKR